jgi:hypothetical protein
VQIGHQEVELIGINHGCIAAVENIAFIATVPFPCNRSRDRLRPDQPGRSRMRRRKFIAGLGGAALALQPLAAHAQQFVPGARPTNASSSHSF